MKLNSQNKPFIILLLSIVILIVVNYYTKNLKFQEVVIKEVSLFSEVLHVKKTTPKEIKKSNFHSAKKLIPVTNQLVVTNAALVICADTNGLLSSFFNALNSTRKNKGKCRIAYFGDSMIEGDLLTQDLRNLLQQRFGGFGVGFVPVNSPVSGFRRTINNASSTDWQDYNLLNCDTAIEHRPGLSGHVFYPSIGPVAVDTLVFPQQSSWIKYGSTKNYQRLNNFYDVKLYYGKVEKTGSFLNYNFGNGPVTKRLMGPQYVNELKLNQNNITQYLTLKLNCSQPTPIFGLSFESDSGVFLDNYAFRGNSGLSLTKIPYRILKGFNNYFDYDLIVLQYGLNVANASTTNYAWYERGMTKVINHLKNCFPNASFLLVSVGDKGFKNGTTYETDPSIPLLVEAQKSIAQKTGAAFWNLYDAMGGYNTMVKWTEGDTAYANKDYTHFNHRGSARVAKMLYKQLMNDYEKFEAKVKLPNTHL